MTNTMLRSARFVAKAALTGLLPLTVCTPLVQAASQGIHSPVTQKQRSTAQQVASAGVPLSELAPGAPDEYTVVRGDTLWGISGKFLRSPWRWPELWGMNLRDIRNPHLIYPGQKLYLEKRDGRAFLTTRRNLSGEIPTVRVSPRNRVEALDASPLTTLNMGALEPFLAEPLVVDDDTFQRAPRIVAVGDRDRVLITHGERAYARGPEDAPLLRAQGLPTEFRIFHTAKPLVDPDTDEILGYEGKYVGHAHLVRSQTETDEPVESGVAISPASGEQSRISPEDELAGSPRYLTVPATIDIVSAKLEIRPGDRLLPEPPRQYANYVPHAPDLPVRARVVSVYGDASRFVGGNQVVAINRGLRDSIQLGDVLAVLSGGENVIDKTDGARERIQLPTERNGLAMVFRVFDRVSYVLIMNANRPVQVGDQLMNPN